MNDYIKTSTTNEILLEPEKNLTGSVIWLHGLGADGNDFVSVVQDLNLTENLGLRFIFPHAPITPITMYQGHMMRAWFDIISLAHPVRVDLVSVEKSVQRIHDYIENEMNKGIPSNKIILAGFSQGASIALISGLTYNLPLAGIMSLSGFLAEPEETIALATQANQRIPIFLGHGTQDSVIPYQWGVATADALKKQAFPVNWYSYPMPHCVCDKEMKDIGRWMQGILTT